MSESTENQNLFPYQTAGRDWLCSKRFALLADEMGLGKSAQSITAADLIGAKKILVLCPAAARINWEREFKKFSNQKRDFYKVENRKPKIPEGASVISSYDLSGFIPQNLTFDLMILDESHFLKSIDALRSRNVFGTNGLIHRAKRTWALSGTPAPNNPSELWPLLYTIGATKLSYDKFVERYCVGYMFRNRFNITGARNENIPELKAILNPIILRRKKDEVMKDLPPIHFSQMFVEPALIDHEIQASFFHWVFPVDRSSQLVERLRKEEALVESAFDDRGHLGQNSLLALQSLSNSVSTLRQYWGVQKAKSLAPIIKEELESGAYQKLVIFAIHRDVIEEFRKTLQKFRAVTLYGGTPPEKRQSHIDEFQKNPKCRVFIGNIQSAGTAITLTAAHHVLFAEQSWVPGENAQAAMRCHRIGQEKPVFVRVAAMANTLDEKISNTLKRKTVELTKLFDDRRKSLEDPSKKPLPVLKY